MSGVPDNHELTRQFAVLEECMKTHQAEYKTDIGQLRADLQTDMARRETRMLLWIAAIVGLGVAILGLLPT